MKFRDLIFPKKKTPNLHYVPVGTDVAVCGHEITDKDSYSLDPNDEVTCEPCLASPDYQAQRMEDALVARTAVHFHLGADAGLACGTTQVAGVRLSDKIRYVTCSKCLSTQRGHAEYEHDQSMQAATDLKTKLGTKP